MKKIGIITFHDADNMGAVLQSYALQTAFQNNGLLTEIIDYKCEEVNKTKKSKAKGVKRLLYNIYYYVKGYGFEKFRKKYINLSKKEYTVNNISEANTEYDLFVTGSDQIWNLGCSGNDLSYYLNFVSDDKLKFSYAASLGGYKYSQLEMETLKPYFDRFDVISIREKSAVEKIKAIDSSYDVRVNVDPVLILERSAWEKITPPRIIRRKYILVYLIQQDVNVLRCAEQYAKENGCIIISNKKSIEFILHNSPSCFLSWIYYAEAVFTNSFHGTAFSVLFNKKLAADIELKNGDINNRVKEILSAMDAEKCIISIDNIVPTNPDCAERLKLLSQESLDYITEISKRL